MDPGVPRRRVPRSRRNSAHGGRAGEPRSRTSKVRRRPGRRGSRPGRRPGTSRRARRGRRSRRSARRATRRTSTAATTPSGRPRRHWRRMKRPMVRARRKRATGSTPRTRCFGAAAATAPRYLPALPEGAPAARRADRAYQIAASSFYAGRLEEAQKAFEEIASDAGSRWRNLAPYLAARAVLRQATLAEEPAAHRARFAEARTRFASLADRLPRSEGSPRLVWISSASSTSGSIPPPVSRKPPARLLASAPRRGVPRGVRPLPRPAVSRPRLGSRAGRLRARSDRTTSRAGSSRSRTPPPGASNARSRASRGSRLFRGSRPSCRRSRPRIRAPRRSSRRPAGCRRARPGGSTSRTTSRASRPEAGRTAEARALVDGSLAAASSAGTSARNLFLELKARNAATFEEFAAAAPRRRRLARLGRGGRPEVRRLHARRPEPPAPPRRRSSASPARRRSGRRRRRRCAASSSRARSFSAAPTSRAPSRRPERR